ncbi:hypothetical protein I552_1401 [Mycobacterium xenopi 3993]|nr:hypothetical protein I552_1401 [Mycobacterium xenopi 3993]
MIKPAHGFFKIGNDDLAHAQHGLGGRSALFLVYTTDQRQHRFGERELRPPLIPQKPLPSSTNVSNTTSPASPGAPRGSG